MFAVPSSMTMPLTVAERKIESGGRIGVPIMRTSVCIRRRRIVSRRTRGRPRRRPWRRARRAVINSPVHIIVVAVMTCARRCGATEY
jgi:hypothetical protein